MRLFSAMNHTPKRYTVTAALLYANGPVHIGHLAGCYLPADVYVRYLRATGADVLFVTGSDEHGVPITIKADKEGVTPQQVVDKYHGIIKNTFEGFGISPDIYSRTSNPVHHETSQKFFKTLYDKGAFTEIESEQFYDPKAQKFLADRYIIGTCPVCANDKAYGDQCERCGSTLSPDELINPHSALSGEKPIKKATKNWYLPLDKIQEEFLNGYVDAHPQWKANVLGQCKSWLKEGLKPRAMTRDLDWGIKLPVENTEGKVMYVWFDAPIGYISMMKEYFDKHTDQEYLKKYNVGIRSPRKDSFQGLKAEDYWNSSELIHFIGKDNIVFHTLIFPAMCHVHGGYKVADEVPANEFLNLEGNKISTSRNWAVWADDYLEQFPGQQDALRYFLISNAPETKDNNFTWKDFQTANNSELVGILGNFVNRVLVLTEKYYEGIVPQPTDKYDSNYFATIINENKSKTAQLIQTFKFRDALFQAMELARFGNKYLADNEPWKLIKTDPEKTRDIIFASIQITGALVNLFEPFLPFFAQKLANMLKIQKSAWPNNSFVRPGHQLGNSELLFEKIEDEKVEKQIYRLQLQSFVESNLITKNENQAKSSSSQTAEIQSNKSSITYDQFSAMDIRVGTVLTAEKVEKADKLLKLTVDIGEEVRTIVSGIAQYFNTEELIGKQVSVLVNLEPRKLRGIESQGMILLAENSDGKLVFVSPEINVKNGSIIK
ncbi:MAG: methionine--tRNA ligase [Bacteroidota bacterium]|nr:methionine--tRNA ligase [Bacteroidota bacterium]